MIPEYTATTWQELQDLFFEGDWNPTLGRHRSNFAFRGLALAEAGLETGFHRSYGNQPHVERGLLRNFQKYARLSAGAPESLNYWDWVSLAQHHGLPTRLMDWTFSPFVSLHFVTANTALADRDGAVWCVDFVEAHKLLPECLREELDMEASNVLTTDALSRKLPDLRTLDEMASEDFMLFFEPPSLDARIVNQYALFSLLPDPAARVDQWLDAHPELCRKIVVKAELKWEARDKLDQANITERVLFPGLDGLCGWLKRHYLPGPCREDHP